MCTFRNLNEYPITDILKVNISDKLKLNLENKGQQNTTTDLLVNTISVKSDWIVGPHMTIPRRAKTCQNSAVCSYVCSKLFEGFIEAKI